MTEDYRDEATEYEYPSLKEMARRVRKPAKSQKQLAEWEDTENS